MIVGWKYTDKMSKLPQALDALISLEKAAGGSVDGPLATIAAAAAPLQDFPASITSAVTSFLGG